MALPSSGPLSMNDIAGEFGGSTPHALNEYYAGGGLVPAGTSGTYGAVPSSGTISIQNFYGTSNFVPVYIEDVFQTWLYTGNSSGSSTQTVNNGIDLAGYGGLLFAKGRSSTNSYPYWIDSARGVQYELASNFTAAQTNQSLVSSFNSNGFTLGTNNGATNLNRSGDTYVSWTFRKQPKFFDIVTYTGNGTARTIAHNLGSVPGCIIIKRTDSTSPWPIYHRSQGTSVTGNLQDSIQGFSAPGMWNSTTPTSTVFSIGTSSNVNANGGTYVAYLFAHDAGGFGLTGTDNVITCSQFTLFSSTGTQDISLGYEPQWIMFGPAAFNGEQMGIYDSMRSMSLATPTLVLRPSASTAEDSFGPAVWPNATGFTVDRSYFPTGTYVFIAIRRGPMKTPTSGTTVYTANTNSDSTGTSTTVNFPADWVLPWSNDFNNVTFVVSDRLRGYAQAAGSGASQLRTNGTAAESSGFSPVWYNIWNQTALKGLAYSGSGLTTSFFGRAPGFFDVVGYSGTGVSGLTVNHNLGVQPELMIFKERSQGFAGWFTAFNFTASTFNIGYINADTGGYGNRTYTSDDWFSSRPTATSFTLKTNGDVNGPSGWNYVVYLFATLAGVSKVGTYTGTGALQTINCGFTSGARFILIKRVDTNGDWYYYNSANGISSGNDPYILLNSTARTVTGTNYVDTASTGFQVTAAAPAGINASGGTYLFLAIA